MKSSYTIFLIPKAQKDLDDLGKKEFTKIHKIIETLTQNPRSYGSLKLSGDEGYLIRVGNYRILYRIEDAAKKVFVYRIRHRKDVYKNI